jgi:ribosomal protein S12 methylthiotransferase accessory factor YcaO
VTAGLPEPVAAEWERHALRLRVNILGTRSGVTVASASCWPTAGTGSRPRFALGLGAAGSAETAVRKAVLEVAQVYRGLTWAFRHDGMRRRMDLLADGRVPPAEPYDHGLLFCRRAVESVPAPFGLGPARTRRTTGTALALEPPLYVDLTPTDVRRSCGWHVVRVLVPHAIPFHCGVRMTPWRSLGLPRRSDPSDPAHPLS